MNQFPCEVSHCGKSLGVYYFWQIPPANSCISVKDQLVTGEETLYVVEHVEYLGGIAHVCDLAAKVNVRPTCR